MPDEIFNPPGLDEADDSGLGSFLRPASTVFPSAESYSRGNNKDAEIQRLRRTVAYWWRMHRDEKLKREAAEKALVGA